MRFDTLIFLAFFAVVLATHRLRLSWTARKLNLLWLSYLFYAAWNPPFVVLLWISTVVDFQIGRWLHRSEDPLRRRLLLLVSLSVNLGILGYFKYGTFLAENFALMLEAVGFQWRAPELDIVLPVGISFYTFQTLSYTLDIYRRRLEPWSNFLDFALFVTFFPQLVAGPIVRARQFLPQCVAPPRVTAQQFGWGLYLFMIGLFEKIVVADGLLAPGVERVFDGSAAPTAVDAWAVAFGFTTQVFCDFSGYSLCAIGIAKCLGFELPMNFRFPFAAVGFRAFWRRWHITLSTWLRDYVYGSLRAIAAERTWARRSFNILVTWGLIGLWHGAAWNFVLWGLISGALIILEEAVRARTASSRVWTTTPGEFAVALVTFVGMSLSLLTFRTPSMARLTEIVAPIVGRTAASAVPVLTTAEVRLLIGVAFLFFLGHWVMRHSSLERLAERTPWPLRSLLAALMILLIVLSEAADRAFIYFQF